MGLIYYVCELYLENCIVAHGSLKEWNAIVLGPEPNRPGKTIGGETMGRVLVYCCGENNDVGSPVLGMARYGRSFVVRTMGK